MAFKESPATFQMIDVTRIAPDPEHPRQQHDAASLKGLVNSIRQKGLIHPVVVRPADAGGVHTLIVGERRWRAAIEAGESAIPALVRNCNADEALEIRIFENLGLGLRQPLEPRDMANALQAVANRFETPDAAAEHFGRNANWLKQATAAANLSPKVNALLDSGKIASTSTALQIDRLVQKDEMQAEALIETIQQLPEGEKLPKQVVESALVAAGAKRAKKSETAAIRPVAAPPQATPVKADETLPPWEEAPAAPARRRVNPGKIRKVAELLGVADGDEDEVLARLIDEFLALKGEATAQEKA